MILLSNVYASNYKLTKADKLTVNKLTYKIQNLLNSKSLNFRSVLQSKINKIQIENKNNKQIYTILEEIKKNIHMISYKNEYLKNYKKYYINFNTIKKNWLSRHNKARRDLWRIPYSYDERLNNTAYEWSKTQENKWLMTHKRDSWDSYYNYNKIEKWFNDRWVKCNVAWWATSSESVWKYWYYCNDYDCTNELDKSLKEIFDLYMAEKWLGWIAEWHYRWITHKKLTKIWLWIKIKENFSDRYENYRSYDYYVTTHYCTTFKK